MARIPRIEYETATPEIKAEWDGLVENDHPVTNMKATLLHSPVALHASMDWYSLRDQVRPFLGARLTVLFCHAISRENACKLCWTYMRRDIIDGGEDPENLKLDEREATVVDYGRQLAADPKRVSDDLFARLQTFFSPTQIVELTMFGALMVVSNIFNSALEVDIDESLDPYHLHPEQVPAQL